MEGLKRAYVENLEEATLGLTDLTLWNTAVGMNISFLKNWLFIFKEFSSFEGSSEN